jgi:hypothetical protein
MIKITESRIRIIQNFITQNCVYGNDVLKIESKKGKFGNYKESIATLFYDFFENWFIEYSRNNKQYNNALIGVKTFSHLLIYILSVDVNDITEVYVRNSMKYLCSLCSRKTYDKLLSTKIPGNKKLRRFSQTVDIRMHDPIVMMRTINIRKSDTSTFKQIVEIRNVDSIISRNILNILINNVQNEDNEMDNKPEVDDSMFLTNKNNIEEMNEDDIKDDSIMGGKPELVDNKPELMDVKLELMNVKSELMNNKVRTNENNIEKVNEDNIKDDPIVNNKPELMGNKLRINFIGCTNNPNTHIDIDIDDSTNTESDDSSEIEYPLKVPDSHKVSKGDTKVVEKHDIETKKYIHRRNKNNENSNVVARNVVQTTIPVLPRRNRK